MQKVRVRIAPSPTGPLHLGTARTALFNFLFARKHGGVFVIRIEDTDLERSDPKLEKDILDNLHWLGIQWDEGPDIGGPHASYRQSERTKSYAKALEKLLAQGSAYYCFCTEEELEKERTRQKREGQPLRYSGKCRATDSKDARARLSRGEKAIIRFKIPEKQIVFTDLIRRELTFNGALFGDIAIAKNPETPLYNFAAVIDDAAMQITHVLRGEDHIANTPKQIAIAGALGIPSPQFGHFPLILGSDRSKLSKRHGATSVQELRDLGYYPQAVVNFLALLGWNPGTEREMFSFEELIAAFDLTRVQKSGAIWNQQKLNHFNAYFAGHTPPPQNAVDRIETIRSTQNWSPAVNVAGITSSTFARVPPEDVEKTLVRAPYYFVAPEKISPEILRWKNMTDDEIKRMLETSLEFLENISEETWKRSTLEEKILGAAQEFGKGDRGRLLWPLRVALSGQKQSDSPFEIAANIGKGETLRRLQAAIDGMS